MIETYEEQGEPQGLATMFVQAFAEVWMEIVRFMPALFGALLFLAIGLVVASGLETVISRTIRALKIDALVEKAGGIEYIERAGMKLDLGKFFGKLVYWFVIIATLLAVANVLGLRDVALFLQGTIIGFIPKLVVAVIVMFITVLAANFLQGAVRASTMGARLHAGKVLGSLTWWAVIIFGTLEAVGQLGIDLKIAWSIVNVLLTGAVAMLAIAGGIAFGIGGKEHAAKMIARAEKEFGKAQKG